MRTTKAVSVTLSLQLYEHARALAAEEKRSMSGLLREALRQYRRDRTWTRLRTFGTISAEMPAVKNEEDVVSLVRQVRQQMAKEERQESLGASAE